MTTRRDTKKNAPGTKNISKKIMMRKYGLDEGQLYVEQSTLLEPNNFIPSWEAGDEEKKEVSLALKKLRKKYDDIHRLVAQKEEDLDLIRKGVKKIGEEEKQVEKDTGGAEFETNLANLQMEEVKQTHDFEQLYQNQYQHMLKRMKKDLIALQLTSNDLTESLRSKQQIFKEESNKQRMAKENKLQSKYRLDNLMQNIEHEVKKRQERILSLKLSIKNKEEALQKRMDRVKRQSEIAEAAANENKDQNEIQLRANFGIQKLWCEFLKKKMEREMKKFHNLEEAFQKIRTSTGNSDVQEMVTKFLTREQTYAQLLTAVSDNEKKLDQLRLENDNKSEQLHALKIDQDNQTGESSKTSVEGLEIIQLHKDIQHLQKDMQIINNRKKNINLVCDQVTGWSTKVVNKLNKQLLADQGKEIQNTSKMSMSEVFGHITEAVCGKLEDIIAENERRRAHDIRAGIIKDDAESENYAEDFDHQFMDFATEEFITKNIRVRPASGATTGGEREDQKSDIFNRGNYLGTGIDGNPMDEDEKANQMANLEMDNQRKAIKAERERLERLKQLQLELEQKNAKANKGGK